MFKGNQKFLRGLRYEEGDQGQIEIAQESIRKQLFKRIGEINPQNGESINLAEMVDYIANNLGLQMHKQQIAQYINELFSGENYEFGIDEKGNIIAKYSRLFRIQRETDKEAHKRASDTLQMFVDRVNTYAKELEEQKVKVTADSLKSKFTFREQEVDKINIMLAIEKVLKMQELEK